MVMKAGIFYRLIKNSN